MEAKLQVGGFHANINGVDHFVPTMAHKYGSWFVTFDMEI